MWPWRLELGDEAPDGALGVAASPIVARRDHGSFSLVLDMCQIEQAQVLEFVCGSRPTSGRRSVSRVA